MMLQLADAIALGDADSHRRLSQFGAGPVHAVAGIGNPARFFTALSGLGLQLVEHAFEDHHHFQAEDFAGMAGPILMTEKDAVKCRGLGLSQAWAVPAEAVLDAGFFAAVEQALGRSDVRT